MSNTTPTPVGDDKLDNAAELVAEFVSPSLSAKTRGIIYVAAASTAGACGTATAALVPVAVATHSEVLAAIASVVGVIGGIAGTVAGVFGRTHLTPDVTATPVS